MNQQSFILSHFEAKNVQENISSPEFSSENEMPLERNSPLQKSSKKIKKEKMYQTFKKSEKIAILTEIQKKVLSRSDWNVKNDLHSFESLLEFLIENSNSDVKEIIREVLLKQVIPW